jgi:hypothetical protein
MPLNKLENFVKNTEGRILYVNPNDIDATDSISNQGNSLTQPFKTIQRALIESARFSYLRGSNNDITEKTTILLFPGEHVIDNRPGFAIKDVGGVATAVSPSGAETAAQDTLTLTLSSNFDITQNDNILYKFNSINGGVVVPRGTSIVGLDLRKTKLRPKYVPNPTDTSVEKSAIFRITGACYFWQFSLFDGDETGLVYTDDADFSANNQSKPTFSHHKLTCFEYADGVNVPQGYTITDLDMYYSKLSNAFNSASGRDIDQKYPSDTLGFAKQRPEWEIVGAFAPDPVNISAIISGDGSTPGTVITVTTTSAHGFTAGTPIKINGISTLDYNISTKVQNVISATQFTYLLPFVRDNLPASPGVASGTVTIETDTVSGASPYIFNVSLRSVWGMNGMLADGSKASGFRSMVVAQFTAVSLQKDDRSFVKYNKTSRLYEGITVNLTKGAALSAAASSLDPATVYHLDADAIYRHGWETSHVKMTNDSFVQIVSVFAIGFNKHFDSESGGDGSITNSNSNFGQISLSADGFKKEAFAKDNNAYVTSIITPRANVEEEVNIDWISLDVGLTTSVGISSHLYLFGYNDQDDAPPIIIQGYRIGARQNDKLYVNIGSGTSEASICMLDNVLGSGTTIAQGTSVSEKNYPVLSGPSSNIFTLGTHQIQTGETVRIFSDDGDLPENILDNTLYYAIRQSSTEIKLASSQTNAENGSTVTVYGGAKLTIVSRVSDKAAGDIGSPVQWDTLRSNWFVKTQSSNQIYSAIASQGVANLTSRTNVSFVKRKDDPRSLDEKLYKVRVVIPKESINGKNPSDGFIIQESSSTGARTNTDFTLTSISDTDYAYNRNPRFIGTCSVSTNTVTVLAELPHNLNVGEQIIVRNVTSTTNTAGTNDIGYNGTFEVTAVVDDKRFQYSTTDVNGVTHSVGTFTNNVSTRNTSLPRFERNDLKSNYFVYRSDVISPYIFNTQDGIYHLYVLKADNAISTEFTGLKYSQNVVDLYPQLDKDNIDDNPRSAKTFAKRSPLGDVSTNDLKKSITREATDQFVKDFGVGLKISGVSTSFTSTTAGIATITFEREHGFSGIITYNALTGGSGYTNGTFYNVKLFNDGTSNWDGATAKVTIAGGSIRSAEIIDGGSGYTNNEQLDFDTSLIGAGAGAGLTVTTAGISTNIGDVLQITGIGTTSDGYYRISSVPSTTTVAIAITNGDPRIATNQYAIDLGPSIRVSTSSYDSVSGVSTFNCSSGHALVSGNRFRVLDSSNNNIGDFLVKERVGVNTFSATTNRSLSPLYILRHGLSANEGTSDSSTESLGARGISFYAGETLTLLSNVTNDTTFHVQTTNSGIGTVTRFPLGSYIQIDNEIMRITSSTLTGSSLNEITVIRGVLGTRKQNHSGGSLIKKIKPLAIEFRRPSIIRASGHTFEYLGYGPGNYSTGLPQVQVKTLTEREDFLVQAQERSCGTVVYTGMNSDGDFFIGNTKYSSSSGTQKTFDIPTPTITGQDPSRLSAVFDEVVIKERLIVEGGNSGTVLSQFDGPVTFNKEIKINDDTIINGTLKVNNTVEITNTTQSTSKDSGALIVDGGFGLEKNLNVGGNVSVAGTFGVIGAATLSSTLGVTGNSTFTGRIIPSSGSAVNNGIEWASDIGGGSGDRAFIKYYVESGENTRLHIGIQNDSDDDLYLEASTTLISGALNVVGDITAFYSSDERLKDNITPIENPLAKVLSISGNTFDWNDKSSHTGKDIGVIAQEIEKVLPEIVTTRDNGFKAVQYEKITPLLIEAIKELSHKVDDLQQKLNDK